MGCFGSSEAKSENAGARESGRERKKSKLALDLNVPATIQLPDPDPALPEDDAARATKALLKAVAGYKWTSAFSRREKELNLVDVKIIDEDEEDEKRYPENAWSDFGKIDIVPTARSVNLGYSDFNKLEECANFVNCRKLDFQGCDFAECETEKAKFPKLLQELNVSESEFTAWEALNSLEYLTTLIAQGMSEEFMPDKLPPSVEDVDFGASEVQWSMFKDAKNLKRVDLRGATFADTGNCSLPKNLTFLDIEETDFNDIDYLVGLMNISPECVLECPQSLREELNNKF